MIQQHPEILFSFFSASWCIFLTLLLLFKSHNRGSLSFVAVTFSIFIWQGGKFFKNLPLVAPLDLNPDLWASISFAGVTFIYSSFFWMACRLSSRDRGIYMVLAYLGIASSVIFICLEYTGALVSGNVLTRYGYYHIPTSNYKFYLLTYMIYMCMAIFLFYPGFYKKVPQFKRQAMLIFYGAAAGLMVGSLEWVGVYFTPIFPLSDLSGLIFSSFIYWSIYRFNMAGVGGLLKTGIAGILYFLVVFVFVFAISHASIWVVDTLHFPSGNLAIVTVIALLIFMLTPVVLFIIRIVRQKLFPVKYSYAKLSTELSSLLSGMDTIDKMARSVLDKMEREFGYQEGRAVLFAYRNDGFDRAQYKVIGRQFSTSLGKDYFSNRSFSGIVSRIEIFDALRLGQIKEEDKHRALMNIRLLNRIDSDLLLPVYVQQKLMGLLMFKHKSFLVESWTGVSGLLQSLTELLGNHALQNILLKVKSEQEHLGKVGLMSASLAHEIKNPLEGIYGAAQILDEREAKNKKFVEIILKDTVRLNDTVQRFLNFSKLFEPNLEKVDIVKFIRDFISRQNTIACRDDIILMSDFSELFIQTDLDGLNQICLNLIQNACRFRKNDEPIKVIISIRSSIVEISVEDNGPGISESDEEKIFEPFYTTSVNSTGLGLSISQKIARAMGGELYYESLNPGSRFVLELNRF